MKNFKELEVWKFAFQISKDVYQLIDSFPKQERWTIGSQMVRAAVSVPSNIAEGSSRSSERDYNRFIEISLGSAFELETQLMITRSMNFGDAQITDNILERILRVQRMLNSFSKVLKGK